MKPCSKNQMDIGLLAMGNLDPDEEASLRAHLERCEGCRDYLQEMSNMAKKLTASGGAVSNIQPSEAFHQKFVHRLRAQEPISIWDRLLTIRRITELPGRFALPAMAAVVLAVVLLLDGSRQTVVTPSIQSGAPRAAGPALKTDLAPTIFNYQMAANRSLEKLDDLLAKQENRNVSPTTLYTLSALSRIDTTD